MAAPHKDPRTGIYYFRRVIPDDLRPFLGGKREVKVSLGTRDPGEARELHPFRAAECERRFAQARRALRDQQQRSAADMVDAVVCQFDRILGSGSWLEHLQFELASMEVRAVVATRDFGAAAAFSIGDFGDLAPGPRTEGLIARFNVLARTRQSSAILGRAAAARLLEADCYQPIERSISTILGLWGATAAVGDPLFRAVGRELLTRLARYVPDEEPSCMASIFGLQAEEKRALAAVPTSIDQGAVQQAVGEVQQGHRSNTTSQDDGAATTLTLSAAFTYWTEQARPAANTSLVEAKRAVDRFIALYGDMNCHAITKAKITEFRDFLQKLPKNVSLEKALRLGKTLQDAAQEKRDAPDWDKKVLSPGTVKKDIGALSAILGTLVADSKLPTNEAAAIRVAGYSKKRKGQVNPRLPLRFTHLETLFNSALFTGCEGPAEIQRTRPGPYVYQDALYWAFLLGPTAGMRLEEFGQLLVDDVEVIDLGGRRYVLLHVTGSGEEQSTKTDESDRIVMLHPKVVELGFISMLEGRRRAGEKRLFDLQRSSNGKWTKELSRDANLYLDRVVTDDPRYVWYSTRHSFIDASRSAKIDPELRRRMVGHAGSSAHDGYGLGAEFAAVADELDKLNLSFIDWERLKAAALHA